MEQLRDLDGVGRGALSQVVPDDPHVQAAFVRGIASHAADEHLVAAGRLARERIHAVAGRVHDDDARRLREDARHSSGESGSRVCTLTDSDSPINTGTRTQVADTPSSSSVTPRILRVSAIILRSSVV